MKVKVNSQEIHYTITLDEICKKFEIPDTSEIDFLEIELNKSKEEIIIRQIEPPYVKRPEGDKE